MLPLATPRAAGEADRPHTSGQGRRRLCRHHYPQQLLWRPAPADKRAFVSNNDAVTDSLNEGGYRYRGRAIGWKASSEDVRRLRSLWLVPCAVHPTFAPVIRYRENPCVELHALSGDHSDGFEMRLGRRDKGIQAGAPVSVGHPDIARRTST